MVSGPSFLPEYELLTDSFELLTAETRCVARR